MIKMMVKLFTSDKPEETKVEVVVEVEAEAPKTHKELFDDAVSVVIKRNLEESIEKQLVELCYEPEVYKDTKDALEEYGGGVARENFTEAMRDKFPKVNFAYSFGHHHLSLEFSERLLIERLAAQAFKQMEKSS